MTCLCLVLLSFASTRIFLAKVVNSLPITTPEESTKRKERQILWRKDSFGLEEKHTEKSAHGLSSGLYGASYNRAKAPIFFLIRALTWLRQKRNIKLLLRS
jgi:hypothetical protein